MYHLSLSQYHNLYTLTLKMTTNHSMYHSQNDYYSILHYLILLIFSSYPNS